VAKLAGLPAAVVERAKAVLKELEKTERASPARMIEDLPLFAVAAAETPATEPAKDTLRDALDAINPDNLSPREALEALYRLKAAAPAD
jgi:DNA mismatch repair protein MutS